MIISAVQIVATAVVWIGTELHNIGKTRAATHQQLIDDQLRYCKPVDELPNDYPQWKMNAREKDCQGVHNYLLEITKPVGIPKP